MSERDYPGSPSNGPAPAVNGQTSPRPVPVAGASAASPSLQSPSDPSCGSAVAVVADRFSALTARIGALSKRLTEYERR